MKKKKKSTDKSLKKQWPDSDETEILELLDWEFKITMIDMLKTLMEKVDNMQEQMGNKR